MKKKKKKIIPVKNTISAIEDAHTGGAIALSGFSYQFLYSCYLALFELDENTSMRFEGVEDIDSCNNESSP